MMGKILLPWLSTQPDPNISGDLWTDFQNDFALYLLVGAVVTIVATAALYRYSARRKLIRAAGDPFGGYTPMRWLWLAVMPAVGVSILGWWQFGKRFPDAEADFAGSAALVGLICGALALLFSFLSMLSPEITPPKFKYRPVGAFIALRRRWAR
jgi:heme/copper-type cytochrome/quinol oxidase subunit 2